MLGQSTIDLFGENSATLAFILTLISFETEVSQLPTFALTLIQFLARKYVIKLLV